MSFKCLTCKKIFSTEYHYNSHMNRIVPCGTVFTCIKCEKEFTNKKQYEGHLARKTPCVKASQSKSVDKITIQKEKTKLKIKEDNKKIKNAIKLEDKKLANAILLEETKALLKKKADDEKEEREKNKIANAILLQEVRVKNRNEIQDKKDTSLKRYLNAKENAAIMKAKTIILEDQIKTKNKKLTPEEQEKKKQKELEESNQRFVEYINKNHADNCKVGVNNFGELADVIVRKVYGKLVAGKQNKNLLHVYKTASEKVVKV
jgi:DNA-directed RNA polymerase subunit RPC12/RpoP